MRTSLLHGVCLLVSFCVVAAVGPPRSACGQGNPLAYQWTAGQEFAYDVEIAVDDVDEVVTYKGVTQYRVDSANAEQLIVTYRGGLTEAKKPKGQPQRGGPPFGPPGFPGGPRGFGGPAARGIGGPPGFPMGGPFARAEFAGKTQTTNRLTLTPQGKVLAMTGESQLPYLLGNVSLLPFEMLPAAGERTWKIGSGVSITEKEENRGLPFGPFGPFGGQQNETVQSGQESAQYEIVKDEGGFAVVKKVFQLSTPRTAEEPAFEISGTGDWTFNRRENVPEALTFSQKLVVQTESTAVTVPISIKYRHLTAQELAKVRADEKRRQDELARRQAEQAKNKPSAKGRPSNDLSRKYLDGSDVPASNLPIPTNVKLPKGLIIAHQWPGGAWHGGEVLRDLPDGQIEFQEIGWSRKVYTRPRDQLQLAPPEVDQPNVPAARLKALARGTEGSPLAAALRTWTDAGGKKTIQATYLGSADGKVQLRMADGREMNVSLSKFSKADIEYVEKMLAAAKPEDDPFEE